MFLFQEPPVEMHITPETDCILQGMIEGKWIRPMMESGTVDWSVASGGNNLIAKGGEEGVAGLPIKIRDIEDHKSMPREVRGAKAIVRYRPASGRETVEHVTFGRDLVEIPVLKLVQGVQRYCRTSRAGEAGARVNAVNLGAAGRLAAYATDPARRRRAFFGAFCPISFARSAGHLSHDEAVDLLNRTRANLFREVSSRRESAGPGSEISIADIDGNDVLVGKGALLLAKQ